MKANLRSILGGLMIFALLGASPAPSVQALTGSPAAGSFDVNPAAVATVNGSVRDGTAGGHTYPLYAKLIFTSAGNPTVTTFTNPFTGVYSAGLVQSATYTAAITSFLPGYLPGSASFTPTSSPFTKNFTLQADQTVCSAPGYSNNEVFSEKFDSVTPPNIPGIWWVAKFNGTTANWTTAASSAHPAGTQPYSSPNMVVFNSYSATAGQGALLRRTGTIDLTSLSTAAISFWMYHDEGYSAAMDQVLVVVSTNGSVFSFVGTAILRYSATPGWVHHQVDISSYAGPAKPAVYIGLVGISGHGNDIYIDNISVSAATCSKLSGGLVAGFVRSSPSGRPIISALVSNTARPGENAYTLSRGEDPVLQDGFYQIFSTVTGSQNFAATAIRHEPAYGTANVVSEGIFRRDLTLPSAALTLTPGSLTVNVAAGTTASLPLVLSNTGPLAANFTVQPAASAITSGSNAAPADSFSLEESADGLTVTVIGAAGSNTKPDDSIPYQEVPDADPALSVNAADNAETPQEKGPGEEATPAAPPPTDIIEVPASPEGTPVPLDDDENLRGGGGPRQFGIMTPFPGVAGYRSATASCDGKTFYVIGGITNISAVAEVWKYNPANNSWSAMAPMPAPSGNMNAACIDGKIYVVGGYNAGAWNNSFKIYDTLTNSWTSTTQPVTGGPMVVAYNGLLYSMGGASNGTLNQARVYDPGTELWTDLAPLPTATSYAGALVYKNLIFIIGGVGTADVQAYDPVTDTWNNSGPDLPGPRMNPTVGWYGDQIYLLNGGGNGSIWYPYDEGYILNAAAWPGGSWTAFSPTLASPQAGTASICADNRLWGVGGVVIRPEFHLTQYYDGGLMCNRTYPAVSWLTATPAAGSVPAANSSTITVGFKANASPYDIPGVYHAVLKPNADAPYALKDVPVTMVVVKTSPALNIVPVSAFKPVAIGEYASYVFTLTNTSGVTDNFTLGAYGISVGWTAVVSPSSFTNLINLGSGTITVKLYPPASGHIGDEGIVNLYFKVHDDASKVASFIAVATIQPHQVWLPLIVR